MRLVPIQITGRLAPLSDDGAWVRSRVAVAVLEAVARGVAAGVAANLVATCAVALWANETAWGRRERRYNVGSVHCVPNYAGDCMRLGSGEILRAYPSIEVGVAEWFGLVQSEYEPAWEQLAGGRLLYWNDLQQEGYGGHVSGRDAVSIYRRVCTLSGIAGMDAEEDAAVIAGWAPAPGGRSSSGGANAVLAGLGVWLGGKVAGVW